METSPLLHICLRRCWIAQRFDVRFANGVRLLPAEPEPFDPLPSRSPGMASDRRSFAQTWRTKWKSRR